MNIGNPPSYSPEGLSPKGPTTSNVLWLLFLLFILILLFILWIKPKMFQETPVVGCKTDTGGNTQCCQNCALDTGKLITFSGIVIIIIFLIGIFYWFNHTSHGKQQLASYTGNQ